MSETLNTAEPSVAAFNAARLWFSDDRIEKALAVAYAIDVAPLIADLARLTRENAAMREALGEIARLNKNDFVFGIVGAGSIATTALAQLVPEQQSAALNYAGPENVGAADALTSFDTMNETGKLFDEMTGEELVVELSEAHREMQSLGWKIEEMRATIAEAVEIVGSVDATLCAVRDTPPNDATRIMIDSSIADLHAFVEKHGAPANGGGE